MLIGCFNTKSIFNHKIFTFNKLCEWSYNDWESSKPRIVLDNMPIDWNAEEKRQEWWDNLEGKSRECILDMPNFDKDIFKEITGIDCTNMFVVLEVI